MSDYTLSDLENTDDFIGRHIGPREAEKAAMLSKLGYDTMADFIADVVPPSIFESEGMGLPEAQTEYQTLATMREIADKNVIKKSLIGMGYYNTITPPVVQRNVLENPAWYTAYTPYQAEISQGRLEAMLNFQTMIKDLTGMEIANASLLDEATAAAEAMTMAQRISRSKATQFFVSAACPPQTIAVIQTRAKPLGIDVVVGDHRTEFNPDNCFGALFQYPSVNGTVVDFSEAFKALQANKGLAIVATDLLALTLLTPPGELGADIVIGNSQRFGVPLGYGGPHAAFMATSDKHKRSMPGRLIGVSLDSAGDPALRMALQTREQHIRREKATSNVCTAQALLAVMASFYGVYHGPEGLKRIALRVHRQTALLAQAIKAAGFALRSETFFDTLTVTTGDKTTALHAAAREAGYNLREIDDTTLGLSLDESVTREDLQTLIGLFTQGQDIEIDLDGDAPSGLPSALIRSSDYLGHPVFHRYRSETEIMRYMRLLADKDLALDRAMIPLGSCTMKLNAAVEMMPVTWDSFSKLHPFVPLDQAQGYAELIRELEAMLCACTGYDNVSLQPNAGSQGEYAGLLAIQAYHHSRGDEQRTVCLIPSSAHGTNPASAVMAGLKVVVVACDTDGNVDMDDLKAKCEQHSGQLSSIMITYPSTHGVFEEHVREVCAMVHDHGGQVYIDGANMNAQVGLCAPGHFGGDVSHLNLHKTFCIPHGGGGPGIGPIGVRSHLAPFLPGYAVVDAEDAPAVVGPVSAAPWGSASILPITWSYINLMGNEGLTEATRTAILNANYMAARLGEHYPVLYTGRKGFVAHEC
ncbi:MAG: aminomethyl-transferring glycine dehydrogenase, partial [Granulosicoccaceae bacterium]